MINYGTFLRYKSDEPLEDVCYSDFNIFTGDLDFYFSCSAFKTCCEPFLDI